MEAQLIAIWPDSFADIWQPLSNHESAPDDLFCELYREITGCLKLKPTVEQLADIIDDQQRSAAAFAETKREDIVGEPALVRFFERVFSLAEDIGGDALSVHYFNLLSSVLKKYNLRYDLRRPCQLCPTLAGLFISLQRELRTITDQSPHLYTLMTEFDDAVRDLRPDASEGKIKTCIQKQVNLMEALGQSYPGVTQNTLGKISDEVGSWPHAGIKDAMKSLYRFTNQYTGIRHGGTPASMLRNVELRDAVAISILFAGFSAYLLHQIDPQRLYHGL